jgi:hypothetical protein
MFAFAPRFRGCVLSLLISVPVLAVWLLALAGGHVTPLARAEGYFVTVQGNRLMFQGQPVRLKGINYYPGDRPWADMWRQWDGPAVRQDLARARRELGINTVRVLVPYRYPTGWTNRDTGQVDPLYLDELQQFVQIAGELDMKVIIALFDFYDPSDEPPEVALVRNRLYLEAIVPPFAGDDRVLAWDLHNEPEHYETWQDRRDPAAFISWLDRVASEIRRMDPDHLITVGMGRFDNLFVADAAGAPPLGQKPQGRTVADISDFLSFHSYNAGDMDWQIAYIKGQSGDSKPIVLQETGWPTGPPCTLPEYNEQHQTLLYDLMVKAAVKGDLAGLLQWQLWDFQPGASYGEGKETYEDYFGLLRRDGTWKPAMPLFRDGWPGPQSVVPAPPLPGLTTTHLPITVYSRPTPTPPPDYQPPLYFPQTGHYIYGVFRDYWRRFGGLQVFGYPLTEQRKEGDYWVQYFERARFEYHPEYEQKVPGWQALDKSQKIRLWVQLSLLGVDLVNSKTGGKGFPRVDPSQVPPDATYFPETGHTISGKIAEYWRSHSGITNLGYPISEPLMEVNQADGKSYLVQYFQRNRLELHPEYAGTPFEIQPGLLGRELLAARGCK